MPLYKGPAGYGRILNLVVNLFITIFFVGLILIMAQMAAPEAPIFTPLNFIVAFIPGYAVACLVGDALPFVNWANAAAAKISNPVGATIVRALVMDLCFTTTLSLVLCWVNNIQQLGWAGTFAAWAQVYPIGLVGVFIMVLIALPIGQAVAAAISGFNPKAFKGQPPAGARDVDAA